MIGEATGLLTDRYELTQAQAALRDGSGHRRSVFEVFARSLPGGRRYGVVAGTARVIDAIENFRFEPDDCAWLLEEGIVDEEMAEWLRRYRFRGSVWGYREGDVYFPGSPVLTVESSFAEAVILETAILSIFNDDSAVATTAARIVSAAAGRRLIEMGGRRTNEQKAVAAARAAHIAGFDATSNLMAGRRYGIPTTGTSAHAFTLLHDDEKSAFEAQVASLGPSTTLLVDTYDVRSAIGRAVEVAGAKLGAVRIDSGDLAAQARLARKELDNLGAIWTKIVVSGNLDECRVAELVESGAPIDGFGVGENVVSGANCPQPGFVYKLVARARTESRGAPLEPVAKRSTGKASVGGQKRAFRCRAAIDGPACAELVLVGGAARPILGVADCEPLQLPYIIGGITVRPSDPDSVVRARAMCKRALAGLPEGALDLAPGEPAIPTQYVTADDAAAAA